MHNVPFAVVGSQTGQLVPRFITRRARQRALPLDGQTPLKRRTPPFSSQLAWKEEARARDIREARETILSGNSRHQEMLKE
eukprot:1986126-Amphidinium_carterae.1